MADKLIDPLLVIMTIGSFLALFLALYLMIQTIVCDYKLWKLEKEEKEHYRKKEDKFKNRKLTD